MKDKSMMILVGLLMLLFLNGCSDQETGLRLEAKAKPKVTFGVDLTEVGTGWSTNQIPEKAMEEAINMALEDKMNKEPDLAIIFSSSGSDLKRLVLKARELLGEQIKIYGGTSDSRGVMTEKGFVKVTEKGYESSLMEGKHGVAIMTICSDKIQFGVGSADYSKYDTISEASKSAILAAIKDADKTPDDEPDVVLITPTLGREDDAIQGIQEVLGQDVPLLGGTTGGPALGVIGEDDVYEEGISLAVIYTDLKSGIEFSGGFDTTEGFSGIVTKVDGQGIVEIDNRPALDVYDEWLGGKIESLYEENDPDEIRDLLTLHPVYRKYTTQDGKEYRLFSHPWPKDDTLEDRTVMTSTNIKEGERIYLSHGTWETLLNRVGKSPKEAKIKGDIGISERPLFGIGYVCGGVMGVIPEEERKKMPLLINYENNDVPFIATFTWGEQGYYPGLGNKHGNLQTGFLVIGQEIP